MCTVRVSQQQPVGRPNDASPWAFAGMVGLAAVVFLFAATPTVVDPPWWALALLMLVALIQKCRCFIRRPVAVLARPGVTSAGTLVGRGRSSRCSW